LEAVRLRQFPDICNVKIRKMDADAFSNRWEVVFDRIMRGTTGWMEKFGNSGMEKEA